MATELVKLLSLSGEKAESVSIKDFKGIQAFASLNEKDFRGWIELYNGREVVPFGKNIWAVPFYLLWQ